MPSDLSAADLEQTRVGTSAAAEAPAAPAEQRNQDPVVSEQKRGDAIPDDYPMS